MVKFQYISKNQKAIKAELFNDFDLLVASSWGKFTNGALIKYFFDSDLVVLAFNDGEMIGVSEYKKILDSRNNKTYYSIGISVIKEGWRRKNLNTILNTKLILKAYIDNLIHNCSFILDLEFITANITFLILFSKIATFIYPNPNKFNCENNRLILPNEETWLRARDYMQLYGEKIHQLTKEACIISRSFEDAPWLKQNSTYFKSLEKYSKPIEGFVKKYMVGKNREYNEFVVRVKLSPYSIIKFFALRLFNNI